MLKPKFLHISNDEKFVESTIELFEIANPHNNIYLINGNSKERLKFVKSRQSNIKVHPYFSQTYWNTIKETEPDLIIIHGLSKKHKYILHKIGEKYRVFWSSWGKDLFSVERLNHLMYKKDTIAFIEKANTKRKEFRRRIGGMVYWLIHPKNRVEKTVRYFKYIDYMSTVVKEDFDLLSKYYPAETSHLKYIPFNYGGFIDEIENDFSKGENILVGNSANFDNNHIETFKLLNKIDVSQRKIIVPLSYGGNRAYKEHITKIGKKMFGDSFYPLFDFLPKEEYHKMMDDIGYAFMNHSHQHAMGNINRLLYNGVKVYMDPVNTAYQHHKRIGLKIFDITNVDKENVFRPLSYSEKDLNRKIILDNYDKKVLIQRTKDLVKTISQNSF